MTKSEYIFEVIEKLSEKWDFAKGLKFLFKNKEINEESIDLIFESIHMVMRDFQDQDRKQEIDRSLSLLKKIRQLENDEVGSDLENELNFELSLI